MALVKPDSARIAKIKVIGVGGGGSNAVASMVENERIAGVEFVAINTDAQVLLASKAPTKLQIGEKLTKGLGAGGNPDVGKQGAEESVEKIKELLIDTDMVFVTAGMGGGTGTGASPAVAKLARESGALTVGVVTKPFAFEGARRSVLAEEGIDRLRNEVDTLIVIPNQKLLDVIDKKMTLKEAFGVVDSVLEHAVGGIAEIITTPGLINVDFADVKAIMKDAGTALLGIGVGVGENRAAMAARAAVSSPLLDLSIDGARGVLFNITGGNDLTMFEVDEAAKFISAEVDPDANIIFGAVIDEKMADQVRITVIATEVDESRARISAIHTTNPPIVREERPTLGGEALTSTPITTQNDDELDTDSDEDETPDEDKFDIPAFLRNPLNKAN
jgi:cell division protein FtsZ